MYVEHNATRNIWPDAEGLQGSRPIIARTQRSKCPQATLEWPRKPPPLAYLFYSVSYLLSIQSRRDPLRWVTPLARPLWTGMLFHFFQDRSPAQI